MEAVNTITCKDIMVGINRLLVARWPERPVYINDVAKDFVRPSFLLETIREVRTDANCGLIRCVDYFTLTIFTKTDEYGEMDSGELLDTAIDVMELFCGMVAAKDRQIKVSASYGGDNAAETYVDLQCEYLRKRTDKEDTTPLMGGVSISQKLEV